MHQIVIWVVLELILFLFIPAMTKANIKLLIARMNNISAPVILWLVNSSMLIFIEIKKNNKCNNVNSTLHF